MLRSPGPFLAPALALALALPSAAQPDASADDIDWPDRPLVVMNLAAHPDDEDGLTMAYYRGHEDAVVYSLITTRGEGGQNEIGPDLYERLGAIRTAETEAAARILGTSVIYLNRYDFGFSKHAWEAFDEWSRPRRGFYDTDLSTRGPEAGRDDLVADVVYWIRRLQPDVLFTNHDTSTAWPNAQHGHHQATGIAAYEAFALANDPTYRPEHLDEPGVGLWQPQRLFLRRGGFMREAPEAFDVAVPVGDVCQATATRPTEACADRAVAAASLHASQGFDLFAPRFRRDTTYFQLLRSADDAPPVPPGAHDLAAGLAPHPDLALSDLYLVDSGRLDPVRAQITAEPSTAVPGQTVSVRLSGRTRSPQTLRVEGPADLASRPSRDGDRTTFDLTLAATAPPAQPARFFQYDVWSSTSPIRLRDATGPLGDLPVEIVQPVTVDLSPTPVLLTPGHFPLPVSLTVSDPATRSVDLDVLVLAPSYQAVVDTTITVSADRDAAVVSLDLPDDLPVGRYALHVHAEADTTTGGDGLWSESRPAAVLPDVSVADGLRVGLVRSYDDATETALHRMGAEVTLLDSLDLAEGRFDGLHTIVLDIRAYLVRPDLTAHNDRLLDWVRRGGHVVVGYHKTFEWNDEDLAPFPLRLGRDRVTMEDAPVSLLQPEHPLFTTPHVITDADWAGWVQERGLYFPAEWDDRYTELVAMSDTGEAPLTSGLLIADVGEGTYAYSALGWYRQLAALNPGAFRLFANLVSLPLAPEARTRAEDS